jgi:hypothetical protein
VNGFLRYLNSVGEGSVGTAEIRAEAWALGGRHRGEVLEGARTELAAGGHSPHRVALLKAVVRNQLAQAGKAP